MNITHVLNQLTARLAQIKSSPHAPYHICLWDNTIDILPTNHTDIHHPVFLLLSQVDIDLGLTSLGWSLLISKISSHIQEQNKCLPPSKS